MQGAIYCTSSDLSIINSSIKGNICSGIYYDDIGNHVFHLKNVSITGNSDVGISCLTTSPSLENVTITGNNGGGIYCRDNSNPGLVNCILWNDAPQEILFVDVGYPNTITISYTDIQGGEAGIVTNSNGTVNWLDGNIDDDPIFVDPIDPTQAPTDEGNFHLTENSPCIDTGDPDSPLDPDSTRADMGAYYFNHYTALSLPTDVTGTASSNVLIPLDYSNIDSEGIEGIEATISFDETLLQGIGATLTGTVLENEDYGIQFNNVSNSLISVWIYANSDLFEGGGTVAYLEFMVDQNAIPGSYTELIFEQAEVNEIPVYTSNGLFTVEVDFKISLPIDAVAAPGEQINIPLHVDNYYNLGIEEIETVIRYDAAILEAIGATLT
jgi:hypothetical protein